MVYNGFNWNSTEITTTVTSTNGSMGPTNQIVDSGYYMTVYYTTNVGNQLTLKSKVVKRKIKKEVCDLCGDITYLEKYAIDNESRHVPIARLT